MSSEMSSKKTSWMAPDSILEPPGLDFAGSGPCFWPSWKSSGAVFSAKSWQESVSYQQVRFSWFRLKFMAFGVRFFEVVTSQTKCRVCQKSQERQVPKSGQIVAKMWAFISPCAFSTAVLQMQALKTWQSPTFLHTNGEAAVAPPWGSSIRRPPKVVQGVLD